MAFEDVFSEMDKSAVVQNPPALKFTLSVHPYEPVDCEQTCLVVLSPGWANEKDPTEYEVGSLFSRAC